MTLNWKGGRKKWKTFNPYIDKLTWVNWTIFLNLSGPHWNHMVFQNHLTCFNRVAQFMYGHDLIMGSFLCGVVNSPCASMGFLQGLWLPPTLQKKHASLVDERIYRTQLYCEWLLFYNGCVIVWRPVQDILPLIIQSPFTHGPRKQAV